MTESSIPFEGWGILELMGHVRLAGRITEESHFGTALGRIDIPNGLDTFTTQYFGGNSIYRLTPTTEQVARMVAAHNQPQPVSRWELPVAARVPAIAYPDPFTHDERRYEPYEPEEGFREIDEDDDDDEEELDQDAEEDEREHEMTSNPDVAPTPDSSF